MLTNVCCMGEEQEPQEQMEAIQGIGILQNQDICPSKSILSTGSGRAKDSYIRLPLRNCRS